MMEQACPMHLVEIRNGAYQKEDRGFRPKFMRR